MVSMTASARRRRREPFPPYLRNTRPGVELMIRRRKRRPTVPLEVCLLRAARGDDEVIFTYGFPSMETWRG